jgi:uncharacterized SAM-binding protein YcdF (DUF218 family)
MSFFSAPSNLLGVATVLGFVLLLLRFRIGIIVAALSVAALLAAGFGPLGNVLLTPLEERFPEWRYPKQHIDGIIVLGGSYDFVRHPYLSTIVLEDDTEPLALVVDLARRYPQAKVVVSGGSSYSHEVSEASIMKDYFASFGIAPERIVTEDRSLNMAQSAQFTANLLHPDPSSRWLLLTYGHLMPRAVGAFRKAGFELFPFPVHLRNPSGWDVMWNSDRSFAENLGKLDISAHEWLGLVYYKLKGYSAAWFPSPRETDVEELQPPPRASRKEASNQRAKFDVTLLSRSPGGSGS